jgi:hypothetical protein
VNLLGGQLSGIRKDHHRSDAARQREMHGREKDELAGLELKIGRGPADETRRPDRNAIGAAGRNLLEAETAALP